MATHSSKLNDLLVIPGEDQTKSKLVHVPHDFEFIPTETNEEICTPTLSANALLRAYEKLLVMAVRSSGERNFVRQSFSKYGTRIGINKKTNLRERSQIAVRLLFILNRTQGLRILSFSTVYDYHNRLKTGYDKVVNLEVLKKDELISKRFTELSESMGFKVSFYTKEESLVMIAEGKHIRLGEECNVVVEIALGYKGRAMFRSSF